MKSTTSRSRLVRHPSSSPVEGAGRARVSAPPATPPHIFGMINAFICINNHVISCTNSMLSIDIHEGEMIILKPFEASFSSIHVTLSFVYRFSIIRP